MSMLPAVLACLIALLVLPGPALGRSRAEAIQASLLRQTGPRQALALDRVLALRRRGPLPRVYVDAAIGRDSLRLLDRQIRKLERGPRGEPALTALRAAHADLAADQVLGGVAPGSASAARASRYRFSAVRYADHLRVLSGERAIRLPRPGGGSRLTRLDDRRMLNTGNDLGDTVRYLRRYYQGLGLETRARPFTHRGRQQINLEVTIPGSSRETILIGAHFDTAPDERVRRPQAQGSRRASPGADDNGTGVAALMETARALRGLRLQKTVKLVHFTGEEEGPFLGSRRYAQTASRRGDPIGAVIIVDAIGFNRQGRDRVLLHSGADGNSLRLAGTVAQAVQDLGLQLRPVGRVPGQGALSIFDTDSSPFARRGIPSLFINEDFRWRRGIHDRFDRVDRIDLQYAGRVVTATIEAVARLAGAAPR